MMASMGATDQSQPSESTHPSGIVILSGEQTVPDELPDGLGQALDAAMQDSEADSVNFSYPFVDRESNTIVATPATADGQARIEELRAKVLSAAGGAQVGFAAQLVKHSRQFLDQAMDEVIGQQPEGLTVIAAYPDPEHNRIVAEVAKLDDAFLYRLAGTYGTAPIAVRLTEAEAGMPAARESDTSPFWGGANVNTCTTGFAWHSGTTEMMVTAGHCFSSGGSASTPAESMGTVKSGYEETWKPGTGTVYMTGQRRIEEISPSSGSILASTAPGESTAVDITRRRLRRWPASGTEVLQRATSTVPAAGCRVSSAAGRWCGAPRVTIRTAMATSPGGCGAATSAAGA
jgi:hypothetical protein